MSGAGSEACSAARRSRSQTGAKPVGHIECRCGQALYLRGCRAQAPKKLAKKTGNYGIAMQVPRSLSRERPIPAPSVWGGCPPDSRLTLGSRRANLWLSTFDPWIAAPRLRRPAWLTSFSDAGPAERTAELLRQPQAVIDWEHGTGGVCGTISKGPEDSEGTYGKPRQSLRRRSGRGNPTEIRRMVCDIFHSQPVPASWEVSVFRPLTPPPLTNVQIAQALEQPIGQPPLREICRRRSGRRSLRRIWLYRTCTRTDDLPARMPDLQITSSWVTIVEAVEAEQHGRRSLRVYAYACAPLQ